MNLTSFFTLVVSWFNSKNVKPKEPDYFILAQSEIGTKEIRGSKHNRNIIQYFADIGHSWVQDDETAWCAAAVGSWLERSGIKSTKALNARSYMGWGIHCDLEVAEPGDIVVFWRGTPNGWQGHVALYISHSATHIKVLGGNQKDQVCIAEYSREQFLGVRKYG